MSTQSMPMFDRSKEPEPGAIRDYTFPAVHRRRTANGVTSVVAKSGDLPLITAHVVIDAGTATERPGEEGIALLTASSLEGGTVTRSGSEIAWALEELGLELTAWTTWDATHVRVTATTANIEPALTLLAEIVRSPAFAIEEVDRLRDEQLADIMQRSTEPRALADDMAGRFIYSEDSVYSRTTYGDPERVRSFTAQDVRSFHVARFTPAATAVLLVGDIDEKQGHAMIDRAFGDWTGPAAGSADVRVAPGPSHTTVFLVDRPGSVQSELRVGHVGVPRSHPDYFAIAVMNALLGGAFTSRLNLTLREKHGFTYGVRSGFAHRRGPGPFIVSTAVATDVTARAIEETLREIRELVAGGPTDDEVRHARDFIAGVFPLQLQTTEELAAKIAELVTYDLPDDYFDSYRRRILAVTTQDAARVAGEHIQPDELAIVVVGDAAALRQPLQQLAIGDVVVMDEKA